MADAKTIYKQAFAAFVRGELPAAIAGYREAIAADAGFALAYQGLAEAHARQGELEAAIDAIRRAIELDPDESLYHTSLSRLLQRQGRIPEAEQAAATAARLQR